MSLAEEPETEEPGLARHEGAGGEFEYGDGSRLSTGAFLVTTVPNGDIRIETGVRDHRRPMDEALGTTDAPTAFAGITHDKLSLRVEGQMSLERVRPSGGQSGVSYLCFAGKVATLAPPTPPAEGLVATFRLTNLAFEGSEFTSYPQSDGPPHLHRDTVRVVLDGIQATLTRATNYRDVLQRARAAEEVAITAVLRLPVANGEAIEQTLRTARRVCTLLTLATGNLVTWVAWRLTGPDGAVVREEHRTPITRKMAGSGAIDARDPAQLVAFMEATYPRFVELEHRFELHRVAHAYVDGLTGSFLQTRALAMGVLAEYVVGRFLADARVRLKIFASRAGARLLRQHLARQVQACLPELARRLDLKLADHAIADMSQAFENKLAFFNEPTLKYKLTELARRLDVDLTEDDIRRFVHTRNELAHRMDFDDSSRPSVQYFHMRYVVERLLLGVLGYRGPFVDCRTWTHQPGQAAAPEA
jgi:hypothetical protein